MCLLFNRLTEHAPLRATLKSHAFCYMMYNIYRLVLRSLFTVNAERCLMIGHCCGDWSCSLPGAEMRPHTLIRNRVPHTSPESLSSILVLFLLSSLSLQRMNWFHDLAILYSDSAGPIVLFVFILMVGLCFVPIASFLRSIHSWFIINDVFLTVGLFNVGWWMICE
jgi:hypothetical protein